MFRSEDMILSEQMHHKWIDIGGDDYWKWFKKYFITDLFDEEILNYYTTIYKIFVLRKTSEILVNTKLLILKLQTQFQNLILDVVLQ